MTAAGLPAAEPTPPKKCGGDTRLAAARNGKKVGAVPKAETPRHRTLAGVETQGPGNRPAPERNTMPELPSPELLIIADDQLRGDDRAAVDELVADVLNDLAGYARECDLLLDGSSENAFDDAKMEPVSDPEQRRRTLALRTALESWQQAWRAGDQQLQ